MTNGMKDQVSSRMFRILVVDYLAKFKVAGHQFRIQKAATVRTLEDVLWSFVLFSIKARLVLSLNSEAKLKGTIESYARDGHNMLSPYATDGFNAKVNEGKMALKMLLRLCWISPKRMRVWNHDVDPSITKKCPYHFIGEGFDTTFCCTCPSGCQITASLRYISFRIKLNHY